MGDKDNSFCIDNKTTFNEKVDMFEKNSKLNSKNDSERNSFQIDYGNDIEPKLSFANKLKFFQSKKPKDKKLNKTTIMYSTKIDLKDNTNKNLKSEKDNIKNNRKVTKLNTSYVTKDKIRSGKVDITETNKKKDKTIPTDKKICEKPTNPNIGKFVGEKIKKKIQVEEKNKSTYLLNNTKYNNNLSKNTNNTYKTNNTNNTNDNVSNKGAIKKIERINNNNNDSKKKNYKGVIDNLKMYNNTASNFYKNKNIINNNYKKEKKECPNPKEKKTSQFAPKNEKETKKKMQRENYHKINNDNKNKENDPNFKDILSIFNNEQNKSGMTQNDINAENLRIYRNSLHQRKRYKKIIILNHKPNDQETNGNDIKKDNKDEVNKNEDNKKEDNINKRNIVTFTAEKKNIPSPKTNIQPIKINNNNEESKISPKKNNQNKDNDINNKNQTEMPVDFRESIRNRARSTKSQPKSKMINQNIDSNKIEYITLDNTISVNSKTKTNSFCKAFFISSFPKTNGKIIDGSEGKLADCGHEECSQLPSFDPEIIYKYPGKDSKELEINNILASISFPNYIKVCYSDDEDKIFTIKNFRTCITNQLGDRFYAMFYHFYVKMGNNEFYKEYNNNLMEKIAMKYCGELNEDVESGATLINKINKKKYVYIPHCICLISQYPYFSQMEKCLESIMVTLKTNSNKEKVSNDIIAYIITYLVQSIPSPYLNTSISFVIPNCSDLIEINPCFYQELNLLGFNPSSLLETLSINNFIVLIKLLLLEQKILFISDDYDNLTKVSLNLISLLYPLTWIHIYIPIITEKMLKYLQSFLPFFSGMHRTLYKQKKVQEILVTSHKDLFIFDIDNNIFDISCNLLKKKKVNPTKFINNNLPNIPKKIEDMIIYQLNILKSYYKNQTPKGNNLISNNIKIKLLFIQVFIELFSNYRKYLVTIGDLPVFNANDFIKEKKDNERKFYKELTSTQLYQFFIQNSLKYINNNKNYFFDEIIKDYLDKKEKAAKNKICIVVNNDFVNVMDEKFFKIFVTYVIKPNDLVNNSKGKKLVDDLKSYLKKEFKFKQDLNNNNIIKENKRIVERNINITNKIEKKEYKYFITPEEENEKENEKLNDKENMENNLDDNMNNKKLKNNKKNNNKDENLDIRNYNDEIEEGLTESEKEDIRDNIKATLSRIFKSEKIDIKGDTEILLSSMDKQYGRNYFIDLIKLNKKGKQIKIISGDSYKILSDVISKSLLKDIKSSQRNIINTIKLLKPCCYFKTTANKLELSLLGKIGEILNNNYRIFYELSFWELWIEDDLSDNEYKILNSFKKMLKNDEYHYIDEDDSEIIDFKENYKKYLKEAKNNMVELKLDRSFILTVIQESF